MIKNPSDTTRARALDALTNMATIIKRERLVRGQYITPEQDGDTTAICTGRRACLIGSLWLGAGVRPKRDYWETIALPGVDPDARASFLRHRPGLRLAYDALNRAAERKLPELSPSRRRRTLSWHGSNPKLGDSLAEALFEATRALNRDEALKLVNAAKRIVRTV